MPLALGRTVGPSTYQLFAQPLGVAVVAAVALCPLLSLGRATGWTFGRAVRWPLLVAAVALPVLLFSGDWRSSLFGLVGLEVCCFAAAAVVTFIVAGARRAAGEQGLLTGLRRALTASRTRSAASVAHFGVILVLAGLLGSNVYKVESGAYLPARVGATAQVAGYTLRFTGFSQGAGTQGSQRSSAHFVVTRGGRQVGLLAPRTDVYPQAGAAVRAVILGACRATCSSSPRIPSTRRALICGCSSTSSRSCAWCGWASVSSAGRRRRRVAVAAARARARHGARAARRGARLAQHRSRAARRSARGRCLMDREGDAALAQIPSSRAWAGPSAGATCCATCRSRWRGAAF